MSPEASRIRAAFVQASTQLGIVVTAPPTDGLGELSEHLACHVAHFGNLKGCIPLSLTAPSNIVSAIQNAGFYCSLLSDAFEQFDAARFRDMLNDWGYFGPPAEVPRWYVGFVVPAQA
jgi:hypothetical protein